MVAKTLDQFAKRARIAKEEEAAYFQALGLFVHRFSGVEAYLQKLLATLVGVSPDTAKAIFSGVRVDNAASYIKRLFVARNETIDPQLERALTQLGHINGLRNHIIHYGATFKGGLPAMVSNARVAHAPSSLYEFPISSRILDDLNTDLETIILILFAMLSKPNMTPRNYEIGFDEVFLRAWRYIHSSKARNQAKSRDRTRKRQDPPQSSQA